MKVYVVRRVGTTEIHGIFWAKNRTQLLDAIDEMADPSEFEVSEVTRPSGIWAKGEVKPILQAGCQGPEREADTISPMTEIGDYLHTQVYYQDELNWDAA